MSRPSRNTDQLLIRAARQMLPKTGVRGLNLRAVARQAGVNLGMFHYHFGTKEQFIRRVLREAYDDFFKGLTVAAVPTGAEPLERLRAALLALGLFTRDHRKLVLALIRDAAEGDRETRRMFRENFHRHASVFLDLLEECQKKGSIRKMPSAAALAFSAAAVNLPNVLVGVLSPLIAQARPKRSALLEDDFLGDDAVALRVDLALRALAPDGKD